MNKLKVHVWSTLIPMTFMIISEDTPSKLNTDNGGMLLDDGLLLVGIAVSWENRDAYYIALTHE